MASKSGRNKLDLALKLMLIFCLALLSFAVGTFVGKNITERELSQTHYFRQQQERKTASDAKNDPTKLSDAEVNSLANEFIDAEKNNSKGLNRATASAEDNVDAEGYQQVTPEGETKNETKEQVKPEETTATKESASVSTEEQRPMPVSSTDNTAEEEPKVLKAAENVANSNEPLTKRGSEVRKPTSVLPELSHSLGKYTVQVGSYLKESEAAAHTSKLKKQGYTAFYSPATVKDQTWFRVSLGLFKNSQQANSYKKQLLRKHIFSSALVRKIVE